MAMSDQNTPPADGMQAMQRAAALSNHGTRLLRAGQAAEALKQFERALTLAPASAEIWFNNGTALLALGRPGAALPRLSAALERMPNLAPALLCRATALRMLDRDAEALQDIERALQLQPADAITLCNRAGALRQLQRLTEALASYDQAIALRPSLAMAHSRRGDVLRELGKREQALESFAEAAQLAPELPEAHAGRAAVLLDQARFDEALAALLQVLALRPDYPYVAGLTLHLLLQRAHWERFGELQARVTRAVAEDEPADEPFSHLALTSSPQVQLQCARRYVGDRPALAAAVAPKRPVYGHRRIRVAYLSGDLHEHPVAHLMVGVLEHHDRAQFETTAVSFSPPGESGFARRVRAAFDRVIDATRLGDGAVAAALRELEVDIAVDLMGYTRGNRAGILARRAAPVQVSYLGYPGTLGSSFIDYLLADEFIIPPAQRHHYAEHVVYLPECFQANDNRRPLGTLTTRSEAGLPERALVLCCFNHTFKITPRLFDVWCSLLRAVPGALLWLLAESPQVADNLRREARMRGVEAGRLLMAPRLSYPEHLGRFGLADLFLDTVPFNAGATASDALWVGVPVLTCVGEAYASRMAGSLLRAVGMPQLITADLEEYERRALELLRTPGQLARLKGQLRAQRFAVPLFDTPRFCRRLEAAYRMMRQRSEAGRAPISFKVETQRDGVAR